MSANDLFSFLDAPVDDDDDIDIEGVPEQELAHEDNGQPTTPLLILKRKAESLSPTPVDQNGDTEMTSDEHLDGNGPTKRARIGSPKPIVLDDFETEAKREIAASAGLTGATTEAGSRLELRHQVKHYLLYDLCSCA